MSEVDISIDGVLAATLRDGAQKLGIVLSATQKDQLLNYLAMLAKWSRTYNLTSIRVPEQMMTHHLLDSLAAIPAFFGAKNVLDVGAGGGLPGMVLAIWGMSSQPDMRVSMIDTIHKKTAFLTQVKVEMGLKNVHIHTTRVEQLEVPHKFDVITSRAFANLSDFINWSAHLLADDGQFIALKGMYPDYEMARLPSGWAVTQACPIAVPGLDAERYLIYIKRA